MTTGLLDAILMIPNLLVEIYGDLAKPGVRQVGKALETVLGLGNTILWPLALANGKSRMALEKNLDSYRQRLAEIPEEKIIPVAPEIGVPIVEKLTYVTDNHLCDLYLSLLTKASTADHVSEAHPSFVNIINNLSPDEAQLLEFLAHEIPFISGKWVELATQKYCISHSILVAYEITLKTKFPNNISAYFSNFEGLGLVDISERQIADTDIYDVLKTFWEPILLPEKPSSISNFTLVFDKGTISPTAFGELFISACRNKQSGIQ